MPATFAEGSAGRAVDQLRSALYAVYQTARAADAMAGGRLREGEFRRVVAVPLFGEDGAGGLRADLGRALMECRTAVGGSLGLAIVARQGRIFDAEEQPSASAVEYLLDTAERASSLLATIQTGRERWPRRSAVFRSTWRAEVVLHVCEALFGSETGNRRRVGVLPHDWKRLQAELAMETASLPASDDGTDSSGGRRKPGKPANPQRDQICSRIKELKSEGKKWQAVTNAINKEFPRREKWTTDALRGVIRRR